MIKKKAFEFDIGQLTYFFPFVAVLCCCSHENMAKSVSRNLSFTCSPKSFLILALTFRSLIGV